MNDIAIYINSFDGYSDIWPAFFMIWDNYWNDCPYNIYLSTNMKKYNYKGLTCLQVGEEINWFERTIKSLENISEEYIIFFLEDYFISKKINSDLIEEIVQHMREEDLYYYQLTKSENMESIENNKAYIKILSDKPYPISLQLVIWKRERFIKILNDLYNKGEYKSPWDFERYFYYKYKNEELRVLQGIEQDSRDIFGYKNGVLQGKWIRSTLRFYKLRGIEIDTKGREIMSIRETFFYNIKKFLSDNLNKKNKQVLKILMKKFGFKFMIE